MDAQQLIAALSRPEAYPYAVDRVELVQTHISLVFLAGEFVYKIKKAVQLSFVDFSTLERRRHFCEQEVQLNRRLAPQVYLGVVPIVQSATGLQVEGEGEAIEWAVKMQRLPDAATLASRLQRQSIDTAVVVRLARKIAAFHAQARTDDYIAGFGQFDVVAGNARDNFRDMQPQVGQAVSPAVFQRVQALTEQTLTQLQPLIERRVREGRIRDTHGDLRLGHVYFFPERPPPDDLVILDCIEFNDRFRHADPIADMAFLVMDLLHHGQRDLARLFTSAYLEASGDAAGAALVPFYTAYRSLVRAKVNGLKAAASEVPAAERQRARQRARSHWLLALTELEQPSRRPCLLLLGGLPGSGKSTLARALGARAGFVVIRSDVVRKELAGTAAEAAAAADFQTGIYTPEWSERTYAECLRRAEEHLFQGQRVLIDANFREEQRRIAFLQTGLAWGVPTYFLHCQAAPEVVRQRLLGRQGDASDADWAIYAMAQKSWEPPGPETSRHTVAINMDGTPAEVQKETEAILHALELLG